MAIPLGRLRGQDKPQVAPPSKSDSFETDEHGRKFRVQHREVAGTNFQIAGVDLAAREEVLEQAARILGGVETVATGDAAAFLERACYRPTEENDNTHLIFIRGEVSPYFVLSSESSSWKWKTPCRRSPKITRNIATASGLHLGQTQEQVIAILGLPTTHGRNVMSGRDDLAYELEVNKKMSPRDLAPYLQDELKQYPNLDRKTWIKNYGYYSLWVSIHAKFINDSLTNLEVLWSETY
jgi:hypothetical protein